MTENELFDAIHQCDDKYLDEVIEEESGRESGDGEIIHKGWQHKSGLRVAATVLICFLILGTGVSVLAATSDTFREWLTQTFGSYEVTEVVLDDDVSDVEPDNKKGNNESSLIPLRDGVQIWGENESFVCEYRYEGDEEIVDKVYSIQRNGLEQLKTYSFQGEYDGTSFSFEYAVIGREVCGFNYKGALNEVFHYINGDVVYAALWWIKGDTVEKGCIVALNLKTGEVNKLTDNNKRCNFVMSPNGKVILLNYRAEGYWTVFDIGTGTEHKVKGIDGYVRTKEIHFVDDYHILTLGKPFMRKDIEWYSTYLIDLHTQKILSEYKDYGEIHMQWSYRLEKNSLRLWDITNGETFCIDDVRGPVHPIEEKGDYVLFGDMEEEDSEIYLINLARKSFMKIDMPEGFGRDIEMYVAAKENKLLLTNKKVVYVVGLKYPL